jgi:leucine dehydrogenase
MGLPRQTIPAEGTLGVFDLIGTEEHESIHFGVDQPTGLRSIVAIHSTTLGPALGGTRFFDYPNEEAAVVDVLRLSKGMTYKAACAGLPFGGGKAVIIGNPDEIGTEALFHAYGRFVESLGGEYITAEDVGTTVPNMAIVATETSYVSGLPRDAGGSGDPSPATARGVVAAIEAVSLHLWKTDELAGRRVAIKGVGKVGMSLAERLAGKGVELVVADIDEQSAHHAEHELGAKVTSIADIHMVDCDIFAPCALGADLNVVTIPQLSCAAIAGSANNQLATDGDGDRLRQAGIVYAPDFVVNAGGIINIAAEKGGYSPARAAEMIDRVRLNVAEILDKAEELDIDTHSAAELVAEMRIEAARMKRSTIDA